MRVCKTCGKPEKRSHRHGDGAAIRYGRFVAQQEREWIRMLLKRAGRGA